jgi:hypothetical protein
MPVDTATPPEGVETAQVAVARAEDKLRSGTGGVSEDRLHRLRDKLRFATLSAEGARRKAEDDRQAARMAALEELAGQVDEMAAEGVPAELGEALQAITDACHRAGEIAAAWDRSVSALIETAQELGAGAPAPGGPRRASAYVAVAGAPREPRVIHRRTQLNRIGHQAMTAIQQAVQGHPRDGLLLMRGVTELEEPKRRKHYLRGVSNGTVFEFDDIPEGIWAQVRAGQMTELNEPQILHYL